ncbi:hypothetical protein BDV11DRAFT_179531 [Aspergillus similis]
MMLTAGLALSTLNGRSIRSADSPELDRRLPMTGVPPFGFPLSPFRPPQACSSQVPLLYTSLIRPLFSSSKSQHITSSSVIRSACLDPPNQT